MIVCVKKDENSNLEGKEIRVDYREILNFKSIRLCNMFLREEYIFWLYINYLKDSIVG